MSRSTEAGIAEAVVAVLLGKPNGEATIAELVAEVPNHITLSAADLASSPTRPREAVWEQQVRNITSHKGSPGNAIYEGKLISVPGGLRLPSKAKAA